MPLGGYRVLLAEDDAIIAFDIIGLVHEAHGEVVAYATSLPAALRLADTPSLSAAILDFKLGPNDSLPAAKKLRAAGVPILFHTGHPAAVAEAWPGAPILPKPAARGELVSSLVSLITNRPECFTASTMR